MAFTLVAPIPLSETTTVLPNPQFGDSEATTGQLNILRTVTGRRRTYVQSSGRRRLSWDFTLTRNKALELFEFYRSYNAQSVFVQDHNGRTWIGNITNNPFEIEMASRGQPSRQGWPVGETCRATLEFEGSRTTADFTGPKIFSEQAFSETEVEQVVLVDTELPVLGNKLVHNWDASLIVHPDNTRIYTWTDNGPGSNDLIGTVGSTFDNSIDRAPTYKENSDLFNGQPSVSFETVTGSFSTSTAAMQSTSNMQVFPNRRGTIFWVFAHTISNFTVETEYGVWALQRSSLDDRVEQVHMSGLSSPLIPLSNHFEPSDPNNDVRLATTNTNGVPANSPFIYALSRDTDTNLRFRTNGVEREGSTILNNQGYTGKFHVNDQKFIPQFNATIRGQWAQVLVYNKALSTSEIEQVEKYLSLRWGLTLGLVPF